MMTVQQEAQVKKAVELMAGDPDIISMVKIIESKPLLTRGHYGAYMAFLGKFKGNTRYIIAMAIKRVGANMDGVDSAIKILNG